MRAAVEMGLRDKVVVITGANRGLGLAIARQCAIAGAAVVLAARNRERLQAAQESLQTSAASVSVFPTDVSDVAQVEALARHALEAHGRIDVWINNAGIAGVFGPLTELGAQEFAKVLRVNCEGTLYGSHVALRQFRAQGSGVLINLLGRGDRELTPNQIAYGSSKAWVRSFTRALAKEHADDPEIAVFAFNPGMVETELLTRIEIVPSQVEYLRRVFPTVIELFAQPAEVPAQAIAQLAAAGTYRKAAVEHRILGPLTAMRLALRFVLRRVLGRGSPVELDLRVVEAHGDGEPAT